MIHLFIGAVIKVITAYTLIGIESINIDGAAYSTLLAYAVAAILNTITVYRSFKPNKQTLFKIGMTFVANAMMIGSALGLYSILEDRLAMRLNLLVSIMVAVMVYVAVVFFGKIVTKADFENLEK